MTKKGKSLFNKIVSVMLAAVMVVTVFAVTTPVEVQAATTKTIKGTGSDSVTIKDADCYSGSSLKTYYLKYKAGKTGYVTLTFKNASKIYSNSVGYVTLCNKSKKALGKSAEIWNTGYSKSGYYTRSYGVKKGTTYYFKVQCKAGTKINVKTTAVTKSKANSKSKAKTLKKGSTAKGIMIAGENKADWYKIKISSGAKIKLYYTAKTNGDNYNNGIKFTFYYADGKPMNFVYDDGSKLQYDWLDPFVTSNDAMFATMIGGTVHDAPSGTYYVKVERLNKTSSGYYTLKCTY